MSNKSIVTKEEFEKYREFLVNKMSEFINEIIKPVN